jgi:tetratricopeptide (TPR) repeat protein
MTSRAVDRDLLFGVLALRAGLIDVGPFAEAVAGWAATSTPPADFLGGRGWLSPQDRATVERLVAEHLADHPGDGRALPPTVDDVAQRPSLDNTPGPGPTATGGRRGPDERFARLHLHAQGGIGRVWLARDAVLGRDVALKEPRPDCADSPGLVARFIEEAQITGRLEHPGIVPVYEMGHRGDGLPFYAMRFVKGRTLRQAAVEYQRRCKEGGAGALELRELLTAFVAVCNAVAYAHSRGILHRDLKGQNVVLGDFGEVLVLDWGLAKVLQQPEATEAAPDGPAAPARPASLTQAGSVLGTPGFMSPEQAEGRLERLGPASDVYSLGALLYEILTGRPPFQGGKTAEVLRQVIHEPPVPPRRRVPATPAALEAVCLKALAKDPVARYASARELAGEVEHWLADEPVAAYCEPLLARVGRWTRRHRSWTAAAAALLLTATAFLAVIAVLTNQARQRSEQEQARTEEARREAVSNAHQAQASAREALTQRKQAELNAREALTQRKQAERNARDAEGQRARAEANLQRALGAVEQMLVRVGGDELADIPFLEQVRRKLLEDALRFYTSLQAEEDRPAMRLLVARSHRLVGDINRFLGKSAEARNHYRQAEAKLRTLAGTDLSPTSRGLEQAQLQDNRGHLFLAQGRYTEAEEDFRRALAVLESLPAAARRSDHALDLQSDARTGRAQVWTLTGKLQRAAREFAAARPLIADRLAQAPGDVDVRFHLAALDHNLGLLRERQGEWAQSVEHYRGALRLQEKLLEEAPAFPTFRRDRASTLLRLGAVLAQAQRLREAKEVVGQAAAQLTRLAAEFPTVPDYQELLLAAQFTQGLVLEYAGQPTEAVKAYRRSLQKPPALTRDTPTARQDRANSHMRLGALLAKLGRPDEAAEELRQARELHAALSQAYPQAALYRLQHAAVWHNAAGVAASRGGLAEAEKGYRESLRLLGAGVGDFAALPPVRHDRANSHMLLGRLLIDMGRTEEGLELLRQAVDLFAALAADFPNPTNRMQHAAAHHNRAGPLRDLGQVEAAEKEYRRAHEVLRQLVRDEPGVPLFRRDLANTCQELADLLAVRGRAGEADPLFEHAQKLCEELARQHPDVPDNQSGKWLTSAQRLLCQGRHAEAAKAAVGLAAGGKSRPGDAYNAACVLARCVPLAEKDAGLGPAARTAAARRYGDRAIALLRQTARQGVTTAHMLRSDPDLTALRAREDFRALVTEVDGKKKYD